MTRYSAPEADPNNRNKLRGSVPTNSPVAPGKIQPGQNGNRFNQQPYNGERMNPKAKPNTGRSTPNSPPKVPSIPSSKPRNMPNDRINPKAKPNFGRGTQPIGNITKKPEFNRQAPEETDPNKKAALRRLQMRRNLKKG